MPPIHSTSLLIWQPHVLQELIDFCGENGLVTEESELETVLSQLEELSDKLSILDAQYAAIARQIRFKTPLEEDN